MTAPTRQSAPTTSFIGSTFTDMQTDVLALVGYSTTDAPAALVTDVKRYLNMGVSMIARLYPSLCWTEKYTTITVVANQADYLLPIGIIKVVDPIQIVDSTTTDGTITPCYALPTEYALRLKNTTSTGFAETYYSVWGVNEAAITAEAQPILTLRPTPTSSTLTLRVFYRGLDNALSTGTDQVRLPSGLEGAAVAYAEHRVMRRLGEKSQAQISLDSWNNYLGMFAVLDAQRRIEGETFVLPSYCYGRRRWNGMNAEPPNGVS